MKQKQTKNCVRVYAAVAALAVAAALSGCNKQSGAGTVSAQSARAAGLSIPAGATTGINYVGSITTSPGYQNAFQQAVDDFLAAQVAADGVGTVDAQGANGTGVTFGGAITLQTGTLASAAGQVAIAPTSRVMVQVTDSLSFEGGGGLPPVYMTNAQGYVANGYADITVNEMNGNNVQRSLRFVGYYNASTFTGTVAYNVLTTVDGSTPHAGTLGTFQVPTCSFFQCQ
jgi:hypothetical protein